MRVDSPASPTVVSAMLFANLRGKGPPARHNGGQPRLPVRFVFFPEESDVGAPGQPPGYPLREEARSLSGYIEGGVPGGGDDGDRHLLVIDRDAWILFETFATRFNDAEGVWEAGSGAVFDLSTNHRRPEGWTSADAAGLAIFSGLVRYDEVFGRSGPSRFQSHT